MKKYVCFVFSILIFVPAYCVELSSKSKIRENIAVLDFDGKNISSSDASIFTDFLRTELVKTGIFNVAEKANIEKIFKEMKFQQTGLTSTEDAVKIGNMLNVRKMILGSVAKLSETYYITAEIVDVESSKIDKSETLKCNSLDEFPVIASDIAERYSGIIIIDRLSIQNKILITLSPKIGYFYPLDPKINEHHNANVSYGADIVFWTNRGGIGIEYLSYSDKSTNLSKADILHADIREQEWTDDFMKDEELLLKTLSFNYLFKFVGAQSNKYGYAGPGLGMLWSEVIVNSQGGAHYNAGRKQVLVYQVKGGYQYKRIGLELEYSYAPTNADWYNVNFNGFYLLVNYSFSTVINIF